MVILSIRQLLIRIFLEKNFSINPEKYSNSVLPENEIVFLKFKG